MILNCHARNLILVCSAVVISCINTLSANAQVIARDDDKVINIPKLTGRPVIDGVLDDDIWSQALLVEDVHQYDPVEYSEPSKKSRFWIFYTEDALYVGSFFEEDNPEQIAANILRQGENLTSDDIISVILDPYLDRRNGYRFTINPNGVRWEGLYRNITEIEGNWDGIWQGDASIAEDGWYTEMRIPFQTISFNPDTDAWGINFRRVIRRNNESIGWVSRNMQVDPSIAGTITGLTGIKQGLGLDIVPSLLLRKDRIYGPVSSSEQNFEPQLDVFYKVTPQLNASLTLNTDFSAAEVDNRQVNLTRFNLFFPERRDFFLRDADIFEFGQIGSGRLTRTRDGNAALSNAASQNARPFFSRRIGLSASGSPVGINYGGKLSGRAGNWNVGAMMINQGKDEDSGVDEQSIFVGRAVLNLSSWSQLGVIATDGNPRSNEDNSLIGIDFNYRNNKLAQGRTIEASAFYQQSDTPGMSEDDGSFGVGLNFPNSRGWRGSYNYKQVEQNFFPAVGFVNQADVATHALDAGYRHFFSGAILRAIYAGFDGYRSNYLDDGSLNTQEIDFRLKLDNNSGDAFTGRMIQSSEVLRQEFVIYRASDTGNTISIPQGEYQYTEQELQLEMANQRNISGSVSLRAGEYYDGNHFSREANINLRPTARYNFNIRLSVDEINLPQGDFTVRLASLQSLISFNNKLSWSTMLQYDNVSESLGINSRLHWIPEAGKQAFLVLNYGLNDLDKDSRFTSVNADLSAKVNYTFRF